MNLSFRNHRLACVLMCCLLVGLCFPALAANLSIDGCAYVDDNQNYTCDQGEQLMTGVPVTLERKSGDGWQTVDQTVTDAYGKYAFEQLDADSYRVVCTLSGQELYAAAVGSTPILANNYAYSDTLDPAGEQVTADIALRKAAHLFTTAFQDSNRDGKRGKAERSVSGVEFAVMDGETALFSGVTNAQGELSLSVQPGDYALRVTLPDGYAFTTRGEAVNDSCVGDAEGAFAFSEPFSFTAGQQTAAAAAVCPAGSLSGKVFEDMNNNGIMDEGEPGAENIVMQIEGKRTGVTRTLTTGSDGLYRFERLPDDSYTISAELPQGMLFARYSLTGGKLRSIFTGSAVERQFQVKKASQLTDLNVGVVQKGAIHGTAFLDTNYNGLYDEGEPGYEGVTLEAIKLSNSESLGKTVTDKDGSFTLENLRGGDYRLRAILPNDGSIFSVTQSGAASEANLFEQRATRRESSVQPISIVSGGEAAVLVGVARGATISGVVFQDANYNGVWDKKEKIFSGVKVYAVDLSGNVVASDTTGPKGVYTLTDIMPGSYFIRVQRKAGYGFTRLRPTEKGGSHVVELVDAFGVTDAFNVSMGQAITDMNAGMLPSSTVSGILFHDTNDDGFFNEGEIGMVSAKVRLLSEDGEIDLTRSVKDDGSYFFDGVMPGKYTLTYLLPEHCEMARVAEGGNTVKNGGTETATAPFEVAMGETHVRPLVGAVTLGNFSGYVFHDENANGAADNDEARMSGATVRLIPTRGGLEAQSVESAADGSFVLEGLRPSEYTLEVALPNGYIFSRALKGIGLAPVQEQTLNCDWATLTDREEKAIGAVKPASISGLIWLDENQSGAQDAQEAILDGVSVELVDESTNAVVQTVQSTQEGFAFANVRPGVYTVRFALPEQSVPAGESASTFHAQGNAMAQNGITVRESAQVRELTTGLISRTNIGGKAWLEENGARTPVSGLTVRLCQGGQTVQTAITDENGVYRFSGLLPADYTLEAALPDGMVFVRPSDPNYPKGASVITETRDGAGTSETFYLHMAKHLLDQNIIFIKPAKVGDIAWLDENRNGLVDGTEPMIPG